MRKIFRTKLKILALDFGEKRIGFAISNFEFRIAFADEILENNSEIFAKILQKISEKKITKILIGAPYFFDGSDSPLLKSAKKFIAKLRGFLNSKNLKIEIEFFDERFSSAASLRGLKKLGAKNLRKKNDASAAAIFLQTFLDREKKEI